MHDQIRVAGITVNALYLFGVHVEFLPPHCDMPSFLCGFVGEKKKKKKKHNSNIAPFQQRSA